MDAPGILPELARYYKSPQWKDRRSVLPDHRRLPRLRQIRHQGGAHHLHHRVPSYWDGSELDEHLWPLCLRDHHRHPRGASDRPDSRTCEPPAYIIERGKRRQRTGRVIQNAGGTAVLTTFRP